MRIDKKKYFYDFTIFNDIFLCFLLPDNTKFLKEQKKKNYLFVGNLFMHSAIQLKSSLMYLRLCERLELNLLCSFHTFSQQFSNWGSPAQIALPCLSWATLSSNSNSNSNSISCNIFKDIINVLLSNANSVCWCSFWLETQTLHNYSEHSLRLPH